MKQLDAISRSLLDRITVAKLAEGVSNAAVNRVLEILRAVLRRCVNVGNGSIVHPPFAC